MQQCYKVQHTYHIVYIPDYIGRKMYLHSTQQNLLNTAVEQKKNTNPRISNSEQLNNLCNSATKYNVHTTQYTYQTIQDVHSMQQNLLNAAVEQKKNTNPQKSNSEQLNDPCDISFQTQHFRQPPQLIQDLQFFCHYCLPMLSKHFEIFCSFYANLFLIGKLFIRE